MPMPTGGAWPPQHLAPAYDAYRDWDAWYVGDADRLRAVYNGRGAYGANVPPSQRPRPGQYSGGMIGRFSRWLWGTPSPDRSRDARIHIPLPADLAATSANLLFSEPPKIVTENATAAPRIEELVEDGFSALLLNAAEAASALGDIYLRPVIDEEVAERRAFLATVHADGAIPVLRWGKLIEVTFWTCVEVNGATYLRLLEHHDVVDGAGRITYALFRGTATELGTRVELASHDETQHLVDLVDAAGIQPTGLDRLDVVRVPNAGPQRRWRTSGSLKYLGRSDFDGNELIFDQIDETWTSWMRDLRLAKARLTVPDYMLQSQGAGAGAVWDPDREIYSALTMLPGQTTGTGITASQFAIRHVEHKATAEALVQVAMRHAGLSSQTLGDEGDVAVTATEAQARERMTFVTRGNRIQTWRPAIADAVELLLTVEHVKFAGPDPVRPNIEFGDSVSESPEATARIAQLLSAAAAASTKTLVQLVHPDWDKKQVDDEVQLIEDGKQPIQLTDPGTFTGDTPSGDQLPPVDAPDGVPVA